MTVEASNLKQLTVKKGSVFSINLWEDRTRGEQWVPSYDASVFALVGDEFLRTTSNNAVDAGKRQFDFEALQSGTHQIKFEKRLAWKFTAEDRRVFQIEVQETS